MVYIIYCFYVSLFLLYTLSTCPLKEKKDRYIKGLRYWTGYWTGVDRVFFTCPFLCKLH